MAGACVVQRRVEDWLSSGSPPGIRQDSDAGACPIVRHVVEAVETISHLRVGGCGLDPLLNGVGADDRLGEGAVIAAPIDGLPSTSGGCDSGAIRRRKGVHQGHSYQPTRASLTESLAPVQDCPTYAWITEIVGRFARRYVIGSI